MRPDYTLSFWPKGISEKDAEIQELIVHIHFDAKYKIANLPDLLKKESTEDIDTEEEENRKGIYKNADLLKMHAYKDAIRRTGGAYVLYPGDTSIKKKGFHEIIPGLGAFPVRPSKTDDGISELKNFTLEVIDHFVNRASHREKMAYRTFDIHKNKPNNLTEPIPEAYGENRGLIPDETFVLIGGYKSNEHLDWILKNGLYNFRMDSESGSIILDTETVSAKYLLLHTFQEKEANKLFKITSKGPKVFSGKELKDRGYPSGSSGKEKNYLVMNIAPIDDKEFLDYSWAFTKLKNYKGGRASFKPFTASLTELMNNVFRPK